MQRRSNSEIHSLSSCTIPGLFYFVFFFLSLGKFLTIRENKFKSRQKMKRKNAHSYWLTLSLFLALIPCALLHFLASSPSHHLSDSALRMCFWGCWLHHGMQTGRLVKPPSTYISGCSCEWPRWPIYVKFEGRGWTPNIKF